MRIKIILGVLLFLSNTNLIFSQDVDLSSDAPLKSVFIIGEYEHQYEKLVSSTKSNLYEVCDNSMEVAFNAWQDMLIEIAEYAKDQKMDINGVKIWMNTFWNTDGSIKHIVFYPKLNSKNIDYTELTSMLDSFLTTYRLPYTYHLNFAHYGQASFPVHPMRVSPVK